MKTECSLQQLAFEVENVYNAFRCQYPFGDKEVNEIKKAILTRSYVLSPLRLVVLPIEFPKSKFLHVFTIPAMPNVYFVAIAESKDALVFIALSRVLSLTLDSYGAFLEHSFALKKKGGELMRFTMKCEIVVRSTCFSISIWLLLWTRLVVSVLWPKSDPCWMILFFFSSFHPFWTSPFWIKIKGIGP